MSTILYVFRDLQEGISVDRIVTIERDATIDDFPAPWELFQHQMPENMILLAGYMVVIEIVTGNAMVAHRNQLRKLPQYIEVDD